MANRSRSTFRRGSSETQRRKKLWQDMNPSFAVGADLSGGTMSPTDLVGPGESVDVLQFFSQPGFLESTILRIRGSLSVPKSTYVTNQNNNEIRAFGIGIVSDEAAEALAVPNPATASGLSWDGWLFVRQSSTVSLDPASEIVDVKAMRKWKSGDSIVFVAGFATLAGSGGAGGVFSMSLRGLFLLP